jgi:hypothetical protein
MRMPKSVLAATARRFVIVALAFVFGARAGTITIMPRVTNTTYCRDSSSQLERLWQTTVIGSR